MKRAFRGREEHFGLVRLYLDDVRWIVDRFTETGLPVNIEVGEWQLDSPHELENLNTAAVSEIRLHSANFELSLTVCGSYTNLSRWSDNHRVAATYAELRDYLASRQTLFGHIFGELKVAFIATILAGALVLAASRSALTAAAAFTATFFLWFAIWGLLVVWKPPAPIVLRRRIDSPSFLSKHSGYILATALGLVIGGVLAPLILRLFD